MNVNHTYYDEAEMAEAFRARVPATFKMSDVWGAFKRHGLPLDNLDRAVDRFLQNERKAGRIRFSSGRWTKVEGKP